MSESNYQRFQQVPVETIRHADTMQEARRQRDALENLQQLWEAQAAETAANAAREAAQHEFNKRMTWVAAALAGAAVVVPFVILIVERMLGPL
jgi:ferric-dicitrate binding protein FerR (iron transport regulator)